MDSKEGESKDSGSAQLNTVPVQKFLDTCAGQNVDSVVFVRHANANPINGASRQDAPHDWKFRDQTRTLSDKGISQCESNRHLLDRLMIKANLTSPARRASDTAMRMTMKHSEAKDGEMKGQAGDVYLVMVESLHPAGMSATCEDMFDTMGYGPLRKFFSIAGGEEAFVNYAERVCAELAAKADGPRMDRLDGNTFAVYGHAVFLNAVVYAIAKVLGVSSVDDLLDADLGEAEALLLDLKAKTITHLK